uniref:uncharacterized protein LOC122587500 n=1 Tax=Erigeron canadensis TaxID=72917 RepID=UPI001CB96A68|nr:uncharacterized protein LOC122587500 [Erigeron canadensis]
MSANVAILRKFGLSNERIVKFVLGNPEKVLVKSKLLESKLSYVEEKFKISRDIPTFIHALSAVLYIDDEGMEKKMQCFRSFGWSDSDIALLFRNQPYCFNKSQGNICERLEYFMKELGYTPLYLISCSTFFTFSLKKRVIPRKMMLDILKEKNLACDKPSLITIITYPEPKFIKFLRGFENEIPRLSEIYVDTVKRVS